MVEITIEKRKEESNRKIIMSIRIDSETFHKLQKVAQQERKTYSKKAREIIEEYLEREEHGQRVIDTIDVPRELFEIMTNFMQVNPEVISTLMFLFRRFVIWYSGVSLSELRGKEIVELLNKFLTEVIPSVDVSSKKIKSKQSFVVAVSSTNRKILTNITLFYTNVLGEYVKASYEIITKEDHKVFIRIKL